MIRQAIPIKNPAQNGQDLYLKFKSKIIPTQWLQVVCLKYRKLLC